MPVLNLGQAPDPWLTLAQAREYAPCANIATVSDARLTTAIAIASGVLRELAGGRFGQQVVTVRPNLCTPSCTCIGPARATPDRSTPTCTCDWREGLVLPGHVDRVEEVRLDGAVLAPSTYRLFDDRRLVRLDGSWPCCQRITDANDGQGNFTVRYRLGNAPNDFARWAAAEMACHLALAFVGSEECKLSPHVVSLARQGVNLAMDPGAFFREGRTGLDLVDLFLSTYNPTRQRTRPTIASPDRLPTTRSG